MKMRQYCFLGLALVHFIFVAGSESYVRHCSRFQPSHSSSTYRSLTLESLVKKGFPPEVVVKDKPYKKIAARQHVGLGIGRSYSVEYICPKIRDVIVMIVYFQEDKPTVPETCLQKETGRNYVLIHRGVNAETTSFWESLLAAQDLKR